MEWKTMVENSSGQKIKTLHNDNGGGYNLREFEDYLRKKGIRHERSFQNKVGDRSRGRPEGPLFNSYYTKV